MLRSLQEFPGQIGRKAMGWLLFFYAFTLLAIGSSLRFFIHKHIDFNSPWVPNFLADLDRFLIYIFWTFIVFGVIFFVIFIWNFFFPLGVLLQKSKIIRKGYMRKKALPPLEESRGEWYSLDLALNKINRDLKKRKADVVRERSELEALVSSANDAILAIDEKKNIRYYNGPMSAFLEQKEEGSWGKTLQSVIRNQSVLEAFDRALATGEVQRIEFSHQMALDSSIRFFDVSISALINDRKNRTFGAVAIFHDITEHKKVEKVRMDFVANASHELKTPLTSIKGYLTMLRDQIASERGEQVPSAQVTTTFEVMEKNLNRLNQLVSDLLNLTKIESSEVTGSEQIFTEDVTESIVQELSAQWQPKNQTLTRIYDCEQVAASRDYLEQVLINLLENAIKYCGEGAEIRIRWWQANDNIVLSVKDTGPGIESYHLGRLFERFYRVRDDERVQQASGTGLGLSIVRHAMLKQGGEVDVKSAPGLGTEFLCYFPNQPRVQTDLFH